MKVTLAQINTTPNDFEGNFESIKQGIEIALIQEANVVVFCEATISGYLVKDLIYSSGFIEKNLVYLEKVAALTRENNLFVIVGYFDRNYTGYGKSFRNMAAVIQHGHVIATYQKHLLPFYSVFDEGRYFEPGKDLCVFEIAGRKCGISICEDIWNDKGQEDYNYTDNPIQAYREVGVEVLFNISSSPFVQGKPNDRLKMLKEVAEIRRDENRPFTLVYVNQIGAQDELVFDGHSCVIQDGMILEYVNTKTPKGESDWLSYQHSCTTIDLFKKKAAYCECFFSEDRLKMILLGLRDYILKSGFKKIVLGSSGGIDSALVATLACLAIGKENVTCIMMPSCYSSEGSVKDAKELHKRLGCNEFLVPIEHLNLTNHINECFRFIERDPINDDRQQLNPKAAYKQLVDYNKVADENIQARMRGQIVMHYSNATGALALTTGNKTELATGYCTLYGDMNGGFNPIGDLYKMEVFDLCRQINKVYRNLIPEEIINKAPSAELKPGQTDEASLLPYPILDEIVSLYIEQYITTYSEYLIRRTQKAEVLIQDYDRIARLIHINEFKRRQAAPTIKLSKVAFGSGRRLPIVKK